VKNTFVPFRNDSAIDMTRRRLPHWNQTGATYFVTFRTADSLPAVSLKSLEEQKELWLQLHPQPWDWKDYSDYTRQMFVRLDRWLDLGKGICPLRDPKLSNLVSDTLNYFDGGRYYLDEYVVMPNHAHVLVMPTGAQQLEGILHSWKSYSANRISHWLGKQRRFWMPESFDRIVRSWEELERIRLYIRNNPKEARLGESEYLLGKGVGIEHPGELVL
jgi:REP element-mobilizing transposase RayT